MLQINKMKYSISSLLFVVLIFQACTQNTQENKQKDSLIAVPAQKVPGEVGNQVKSEAPDALSKTEQGYALPRFDDGMAQSPINILTNSALKASHQEINIKFNIEISAAENLGHTIQIDFKEGSTSIADGKTYQAKQFHFHTPSEHLIDGMTFPMELHIVNILKDSGFEKNPKYLVVALLFKMGRENKFLDEFLNSIPGEENKKEILPSGKVLFKDLLKNIPENELGAYYTYKGSLTTPPYTESVDWVVRKYILEASPEQINTIEKMEGNNARHVQAPYERKVVSN